MRCTTEFIFGKLLLKEQSRRKADERCYKCSTDLHKRFVKGRYIKPRSYGFKLAGSLLLLSLKLTGVFSVEHVILTLSSDLAVIFSQLLAHNKVVHCRSDMLPCVYFLSPSSVWKLYHREVET